MTPTTRIESLDFLRGVASLSVCWFHLVAFHYPTSEGLFSQAVRASGAYGWLGVEVFFVISGFVIPYSLNRAGYTLKSYPSFILKRLLRLEPPYLVTIALLLLLAFAYAGYTGRAADIEGAPIGLARVLLHLGYLTTFFGYEWLNPSFWTLAVEFQYYLMMGLAFPLLNSTTRWVRLVSLLCFVAAGVFFDHGPAEAAAPSSNVVFVFAPLFAMGHLTFQKHSGLLERKEYLSLLLLVGLVAFKLLGAPATLAGLFSVLVINLYHRQSAVARFFGNISYSLYLLHWPLGHLTLSIVGYKLLGATGDAARTFVLITALGVCIGSAYLLYLFVERPAQRWSAAIRYGAHITSSRRQP